MFEELFGNKNIGRTLLYLFVHNQCFASELHRAFSLPLTPFQNALQRLETKGVILSYFLGKTRMYTFNPSYPLLQELNVLLKKAYSLLSPVEKKHFFDSSLSSSCKTIEQKQHVLSFFWKRLQNIKRLSIHAESCIDKAKPVQMMGSGIVNIIEKSTHTLVFEERGKWLTPNVKKVNFTNTFRFSIDRMAAILSVEHLRQGITDPVFLFHLCVTSENTLGSVDSYFCKGDGYFGQMFSYPEKLVLKWRLIGQKKEEQIIYEYFI